MYKVYYDLDLFIKTEGRKITSNLLCDGLWKCAQNHQGHTRIISVVKRSYKLEMISDHMYSVTCLKVNRNVVPDARSAWKGILYAQLKWFNDSSKIKGGTDAGIHRGRLGEGQVGIYPSVFQSEITVWFVWEKLENWIIRSSSSYKKKNIRRKDYL